MGGFTNRTETTYQRPDSKTDQTSKKHTYFCRQVQEDLRGARRSCAKGREKGSEKGGKEGFQETDSEVVVAPSR